MICIIYSSSTKPIYVYITYWYIIYQVYNIYFEVPGIIYYIYVPGLDVHHKDAAQHRTTTYTFSIYRPSVQQYTWYLDALGRDRGACISRHSTCQVRITPYTGRKTTYSIDYT